MKIQKILKSKIAMAVLLVIAVLLGISQLKQWRGQQAIQKEIDTLATESEKLDQKNKELRDSLVYLHSTTSRERTARQQLNLKKDGEIAVSFTDAPAAASSIAPPSHAAKESESNAGKWWDYFFDTKR